MSDSGSFEPVEERYDYVQVDGAPSPKRVRYDEAEFEHAQTDILAADDGDETVITVPQSQFEIEINSQQELSGSSSPVPPMHLPTHELGGPSFGVIQDGEQLSPLEVQSAALQPNAPPPSEDTSTLNAIGRVLLQMQQQQVSSGVSTSPVSQRNQLVLNGMASDSGQSGNAPLYVMIPPSSSAEILQAMGQSRPIAPKETDFSDAPEDVRKNREAQRKATHNEVERRRRDRINELIKSLAQIVPGCQKKDASTGNIVGYVYSKGTVLDKTVEYLKELMHQNEQLSSTAKLAEKSANALSLLQNQITVLEKENAFLRAQIIQLGIDVANNSQSLNRQLMSTSLAQSLLNSTGGATPTPSSTSSIAATQQLLLSLAQSLSQPSPPVPVPSPHPVTQLASLLPSQPSAPTTPLLTSLVQTLASIAGTTTTQANTIPRVSPPNLQSQTQSSIPVSAAANLLNTLLMAQNVMSGSGASGQEGDGV